MDYWVAGWLEIGMARNQWKDIEIQGRDKDDYNQDSSKKDG